MALERFVTAGVDSAFSKLRGPPKEPDDDTRSESDNGDPADWYAC